AVNSFREVVKITGEIEHSISKVFSRFSTRVVQFPQKPAQQKTYYDANAYPSHSSEPRLLCNVGYELYDCPDCIAGLWLLLDEVNNNRNNNVFEDEDNACEDGSYPASPSRGALHRIDHK